jgi:hypothetical protein
MVGQVTAVAILMIVQGVLEIGIGLLLLVMSVFIPMMMEEAVKQQPQPPPPGLDAFPLQVMTTVYAAMASAGILAGIIHIIGGIMGLRYRGRTLGIVALLLGLVSVATCYCSVTTIGLAVYGLIVYFNADVAHAFELASQGMPVSEIKRMYVLDPERFRGRRVLEPERYREIEEEETGDRGTVPEKPEQSDQFYGDDFRPKT